MTVSMFETDELRRDLIETNPGPVSAIASPNCT
jgi:hypothetical protein